MAGSELTPEMLSAVASRLDEQNKRKFIDLDELIRETKFSKEEIRMMYRGFKQECPNGIVNEDTFKEIYEKFFPYGNVTSYAHHVFKAFDVTSTGSISFRDMLISLSTLLHGTQYEKLIWTFRVYDLNGDGVITKSELGNVVVAVYELMGIILRPPSGSTVGLEYIPKRRDSVTVDMNALSWMGSSVLEMTAGELRENVETAFNRLDTNNDGVLTREEFVASCLQNEDISSSLGNFQFNLL